MDNAVGPAFASLYARQQQLLGKGRISGAQASASCKRNGGKGTGKTEESSGAGEDWVCQILLQLGSLPTSQYTYELNVKADGCYVADGPPGLIGGPMLSTPSGSTKVNPLFAFDGCFDT